MRPSVASALVLVAAALVRFVGVSVGALAVWLAPIHLAIPLDDQQLGARLLLEGWRPVSR